MSAETRIVKPTEAAVSKEQLYKDGSMAIM
jgi:hypothetical protein